MQETLTTEIYKQIDCMKLHLRNLQEVAEIEKLMPVSCEELHKGIAEMEKALVHFMNFEKLLKAKNPKKPAGNVWDPVADILSSAWEKGRQVLIDFEPDYFKVFPITRRVNQAGNVVKAGESYVIHFAEFTLATDLKEWGKIIQSIKIIE